jgi:hypothetical protein
MSDIQTFVATESDGSQWVSLAAYEAAIHHLSASREEVARLREAARGYQEAASDALYGQGDEEDNASAYDKADGQLTAALSASPAPAKTCRWYLQNALGKIYRTPHGQEVGLPFDISECPYCGLPIEEVKEETT